MMMLMMMKKTGPDVLVIIMEPTKFPTIYDPIKKVQKIEKKVP